jgi:hypothetical protein
MRIRALLFLSALAVVVLGVGASGASAATLWTTAAHTTRVAVGATGDAINSGAIVMTANGTNVVNSCNASTLHLVVGENTDTRVSITATGGTITSCTNFPLTPTFSPAWKVTVTGSSAVIGANTVFTSTVHNFAFDLVGVGLFAGNLETGVTATQVTFGTAPICLTLSSVTGLIGPAEVTLDGRYCFEGAAAAWSLTT